MPVTFQFGNHVFAKAVDSYVPVSDYHTSMSYGVEETRRANAHPKAARRGYDLKPVSFTIDLCDALGVDPEQEYNELEAICRAGKAKPLYKNGISLSKYQFILTSVDPGVAEFDLKGKIIRMPVALEFREYTKKVSAAEMKAQSKRGA